MKFTEASLEKAYPYGRTVIIDPKKTYLKRNLNEIDLSK